MTQKLNVKTIIKLAIAFVVIIAALVINPFSINDSGNRQVVQTLGGNLEVKFTPGLYFSGFFSTVTTWPNNVTIQVGPEKKRSSEADYWETSNTATFSEGDEAGIGHTVKWDLPNTVDEMLELHTTYNNIKNLMTTTLLQYQKETVNYSTQRMSSEAHYSGGQSQLKEYFQDQLRNGQVLLQTETRIHVLDDGSTRKYIDVQEIRNEDSIIVRTISDIQKYKLYASFASIDYVKYDPRIYEKLKAKIDAAADEATSKQRLITAQQEEQEAYVQGRKLISEVKAKEEALEQESIIRARKEKLVAKEQADQAMFIADKIEEEGRAEAAKNRALVSAGLTPQEKAEWDFKTKVGVARELAKVNVPNIVVGGSGGGASPMDAIGIKFLMDINDKLSK